VKVGLGYIINYSADCLGFVVDKVTLALDFPKTSIFRSQFHPTKAQHKCLIIYFVEGKSDFDEWLAGM
jgi:hypothetical protein